MPDTDAPRRTRSLTWRIAGLWMVVLALGLAVVGVVVALQQARSLAYKLMAPAEARAREIAGTAQTTFDQQLEDTLESLRLHLRTDAGGSSDLNDPPHWAAGLYAWDGAALRVIREPNDTDVAMRDLVQTCVGGRLVQPLADAGARPDIVYDTVDGAPVAVACKLVEIDGQPLLLAAGIDLPRLRSAVLEPLLPGDGHLELFDAAAHDEPNPWAHRLAGPMRFWGIRPTEAFIDEQSRTVIGQTVVYLVLTALALITLLIAMAVLVRAVRREMALAEMKSSFVANVSHELKTPLSLIQMFGETLQSGRVTSEEKRQEYYRVITRESVRLSHLINNILDFARIESGRKNYRFEPTDVAAVVRETYETYGPQLEDAGFEHHLSIAEELPEVEADRDAIAQIVINLMSNAIKYSEQERYLAIDVASDTRRGRRGVLISVHDRGIGIRPEDRAQLVEGFFRAGDRRVREKGGTGLGLALVKQLVDDHHGSLDVESRLVKGSTFRVFLPVSQRRPGVTTERQR